MNPAEVWLQKRKPRKGDVEVFKDDGLWQARLRGTDEIVVGPTQDRNDANMTAANVAVDLGVAVWMAEK